MKNKKILIITGIFFVISAIIVALFTFTRQIPLDKIIIRESQKYINGKINLGGVNIDGNKATIDNIIITSNKGQELINVKKLDVKYNLENYIKTRELSTSINDITLISPVFNINYSKDGRWNLQEIFKYKKPPGKNKKVPFNGNFVVNDGKIEFKSYKPGFPLNIVLSGLDFKAELNKNPQVSFSMRSPLLSVEGGLNYITGDISFNVKLDNLKLKDIADLVPKKPDELNIKNGKINGDLSVKIKQDYGQIIYNITGLLDLTEGEIDYKSICLKDINSKVIFNNDTINILYLNGRRENSLFNIKGKISNLKHPHMDIFINYPNIELKGLSKFFPGLKYNIDGMAALRASINGSIFKPYIMASVTSSKISVKEKLIKDISIKGSYVDGQFYLEKLDCLLDKGKVSLWGMVSNIKNSADMDLDLKVSNFNPSYLAPFIEGVKKYKIYGSVTCSADIFGSPFDPVVIASVSPDSYVSSMGVYAENIQASLIYYKKYLNISELSAKTREGDLDVKGDIFGLKNPDYHLFINAERLNFYEIEGLFPNTSFDDIKGRGELKLEIAGHGENVMFRGNVTDMEVIAKGQTVNNLRGNFEATKDIFIVKNIYGLWNSNPFSGCGTVYTNPEGTMELFITAPRINPESFSEFYPEIKKLDPEGNIKVDTYISGYIKRPLISSIVEIPCLKVKDYFIKKFQTCIYSQDRKVWIPEIKGNLSTDKNDNLPLQGSLFLNNSPVGWLGKGFINSWGGRLHGMSLGKVNICSYIIKDKIFLENLRIKNIGGPGRCIFSGYIGKDDINLTYAGNKLNLNILGHFIEIPSSLEGDTSFSGTLKGSVDRPLLDGMVIVENGKFREMNFSINSGFKIDKNRLYLSNLTLLRENGLYSLKGKIGLKKPWNLTMEGNINGGIISQWGNTCSLIKTLNMNGDVRGKVVMRGNLEEISNISEIIKKFYIGGELSLLKGTLKNIKIDKLNTDFELREGKINLSNFYISRKSSSLQAKGSYDTKTDEVVFNFASPKFLFKDFDDLIKDYSLKGEGQVNGKIEGKINAIKGEASFQLLFPSIKGYSVDWTGGEVKLEKKILRIEKFVIKKSNDLYQVNGNIDLNSEPELFLILNAQDVRLENLFELAKIRTAVPITGSLSAQTHLRGFVNSPVLSTTMKINDMAINSFPVKSVEAELHFTPREFYIGNLKAQSGEMNISGKGYIKLDKDTNLTIEGSNMPVDLLEKSLGLSSKKLDMEGIMDVNLQATGKTENLDLIGSLQVRDAAFNQYKIDRIRSLVTYNGKVLNIKNLQFVKKDVDITAEGIIPIEWKENKWIAPEDMDIAIKTSARDLNIINALNPDFEGTHGEIKSNFHIGGILFAPSISGRMEIKDGLIQHNISREPLKDINLIMNIDNNCVTLENFEAMMGDGKLKSKGVIYLEKFLPKQMALSFSGDNILLDLSKFFRTQLTATGTLEGNMDSLKINGDILLDNYTAEIYPGIISSTAIPPKQMKGVHIFNLPDINSGKEKIKVAAKNPDNEKIELNMDLNIGNNFWVKSLLFRIKPRGNVRVGGTLTSPALSGIIKIPQGTLNLIGPDFSIKDEARVIFNEENGYMPNINIKANTFVDGREIIITVTGLANNMNTTLTSDPPMSANDLSQLLSPGFNTPVNGNYNFLQSTAFGLAKGTVASYVLNPIEETLGKSFGLDVFSINLSDQGNIGFDIGKNVTDNIRISYHIYNDADLSQMNVSNYLIAREVLDLQFKINRHVQFNLGTNTIGGITGNIQLEYHF